MPKKMLIHLTIAATSRCNRGCSHCATEATMDNPKDFSKKMARALLVSADKLASRIYVSITGGGEPLLHPELVNLVEIFTRHRKVSTVHMVTSGFLPEDAAESHKFN